MEPLKEPISVRISRLNNQLITKNIYFKGVNLVNRDALLDALNVLYEECNNEYLKKNDKYISQFIDKFRTSVSELKQIRPSIFDFEVRNVIGRGHFGEVNVVREKQTGDVYAMKTLRKSDILNQSAISFHQEERDIMATATSPWLTTLQYSFQDTSHLYFIMEFHSGGDLLALLERHNGTLPESYCKFYLAELTLAINALHSMGYVHRDLKPENILLDRCGHLKLADFGSSAKLTKDGKVTRELPVGTPEYIAPEVLKSMEAVGSYGIECDYWSLGIIAYEICAGSTPFRGSAVTSIYNNIMNHSQALKFPEECNISEPYKNFICALLMDGNVRLTYDGCLKHEFFKNVNWNGIRDEVPPFVPKVNSIDDTSNFIEFEHKPHVTSVENFKRKTNFSGRNLPFIGFTYTPDAPELEISVHIKSNQTKITHNNDKTILEEKKKEVEYLHKKLAEVENDSKDTKLLKKRIAEIANQMKKLEANRDDLEKELALSQNQVSHLKRTLEAERLERKEIETKALELIKISKKKWEQSEAEKVAKLNEQIEEGTQRITELCTQNNDLISQLERYQTELASAKDELHKLRNLQAEYKDNMIKARELNRQSIAGVQSHLEKMNYDAVEQIERLKQKLKQESEKYSLLESELTSHKNTINKLNIELETNIQENFSLKENEQKLKEQCEQLISLRQELIEAKQQLQNLNENQDKIITDLKETLAQERSATVQYQEQIHKLTTELEKTRKTLEEVSTQLQSTEKLHEREMHKLTSQLNEVIKDREELQVRFQEVQESDEINRSKVNDLEELVSRLEQGVARLEASEGQEDIIAKLEAQLASAHEALAIEKQEARTAKTNLWRKEKELSDMDLDKRILTRELKTAEDTIKTLNQRIEEISKENQTEKERYEKQIEQLQKTVTEKENQLENLKKELNNLKDNSRIEKAQFNSEKSSLIQTIETLKKKEAELESLKNEKNTLQKQYKNLEAHLTKIEKEKQELNESFRKSNLEITQYETLLNERNREFKNLELNYSVLKEACTMLHNQLENYDCLIEEYEKKQKKLMDEIEGYKGRIEQLQKDIQKAKQNTNEEKSHRLLAEKHAERLKQELSDVKTEKEALENQLSTYKTNCESLNEQLGHYESQISDRDLKIKNLERNLESAYKQLDAIKEESSERLTLLISVKESNQKLTHELNIAREEIRSLEDTVETLESKLQDQLAYYQQREMKSEATMRQHSKLISYLQTKLEEHTKKKKTFTDKLFGTSKKENIPCPNYPSAKSNRDFEIKYQEEVAKNKKLTEELKQIKNKLNKMESKDETPKSLVSENNENKRITLSSITTPLEGYVKMTDGTKWDWNQMFLRLDDTKLKCYERLECTSPVLTIDLASPDHKIFLQEDISSHECLNVDSRDVPLIIKLEVEPKTTCWPKTSHYIMPPNDTAKKVWVHALKKFASERETSICSSKVVWKYQNDRKIYTIYELIPNILLIGTDEGIYSYNMASKSAVLLAGLPEVKQIDASKYLNRVILIAGPTHQLLMVCSRLIESLAKSSPSSNPKITNIEVISDETFHLFALSRTDMICAATQTKIMILKYNTSIENYKPVRILDTAQPCSCMLFREHSLLVGANKYFEIDLSNFSAEEFLDASDNSLLQAVYCHKVNSFPIALIDVSKHQDEYLICFNEFGVFVDEFGRRSRANNLRWNDLPLKIVFSRPYLFVFHLSCIKVTKIDDVSSEYNPLKLDFENATFAGVSKSTTGAIYISYKNTVQMIEGAKVLDDTISELATSSDQEINDGQFSFTSSMVESLDRDDELSVSESDTDFNKKKVQFQK